MTMTLSGAGAITGLTSAPGVAVNGPAFSAYGTALQSLSNVTWTKVAFNTETFDTNSNFDTATYRFTPTVAGYYQVNATISHGAISANYGTVGVYVNGVVSVRGNYFALTPGGTVHTVSGLVYLNGTTDYMEIYMYQSSGSTISSGSSNSSYPVSCFLARAA